MTKRDVNPEREIGGSVMMRDQDWDRLIYGLTRGECTPFLGAGICHGTLPTGTELSEQWAADVKYPFPNAGSLPEVMDFASILEGDAVHLKEKVIQMLRKKGDPDFTRDTEPHSLLARFPLPVYLTTNYDDFMVKALGRQGKRPHAMVCPWYLDVGEQFEEAGPARLDQHEPIVFHLHGRADIPRSLVLSRTDYIEFLVSLSKDYGSDNRRLIPSMIQPSLTRLPMLFIGYSLQDWTFSVLFQSLIRTVSEVQRRRHISVQLLPPNLPPDKQEAAREYLSEYYRKWNIAVYWGTVDDFCKELRRRLGWDS